MKFGIRLFFIFCCSCAMVIAQNPKERLKSLKVSYLTDKIELTPIEAQKFWPIYNIYDEAIQKMRRTEGREILENYLLIDKLSDEEAGQVIEQYIEIEEKRFKERRQLIANLKGVLSNKRIILLLKAERDFNQEMISRFRDRFKTKE